MFKKEKHSAAPKQMVSSAGSQSETVDADVSRRDLTSILGALGLVTLAGCITGATDEEPDLSVVSSALSGTGFIWVDTVANLYGTTPASKTRGAIVGGYTTVGDGGGGVFYWDPSSTAGNNRGTIAVPTTGGGRWLRLYSGHLNVRYFGAKGDNVNTDDVNINLAIAAAAAVGGGELYFPPGTYKTIDTININSSSITLRGATGGGSRIAPVNGSTYDTITINGTHSSVSIRDLYFVEGGKGLSNGANTIFAAGVSRLSIIDCTVESPCNGMRFHNCNTVEVERVRVAGQRGANSYGFWLTGDATGSFDVCTFKNVVVQGDGLYTTHSRHGLIIDGRVNTISAYKFYAVNPDGCGVWFRNTMGTGLRPEFATFYGLEVDFPYLQGLKIDEGRELYFTDTQIHGAMATSNISIEAGAACIDIKGGFTHGAYHHGIEIAGQQVSVQGMDIHTNSGMSVNTFDGLRIYGQARMISVIGNKVGDPANPRQISGITIQTGADQFAIVGNLCFYNYSPINNYAGTGPSKVVANNAV